MRAGDILLDLPVSPPDQIRQILDRIVEGAEGPFIELLAF
jgi:hypothetical protein